MIIKFLNSSFFSEIIPCWQSSLNRVKKFIINMGSNLCLQGSNTLAQELKTESFIHDPKVPEEYKFKTRDNRLLGSNVGNSPNTDPKEMQKGKVRIVVM